jgi:hypothetical protein
LLPVVPASRYPCAINSGEAECITGQSSRTHKCVRALRARASCAPLIFDVMPHDRRSLKVCTRLGRSTIAPSSSAQSGSWQLSRAVPVNRRRLAPLKGCMASVSTATSPGRCGRNGAPWVRSDTPSRTPSIQGSRLFKGPREHRRFSRCLQSDEASAAASLPGSAAVSFEQLTPGMPVHNKSLDTDTQRRAAPSARVLRAGQLRRRSGLEPSLLWRSCGAEVRRPSVGGTVAFPRPCNEWRGPSRD